MRNKNRTCPLFTCIFLLVSSFVFASQLNINSVVSFENDNPGNVGPTDVKYPSSRDADTDLRITKRKVTPPGIKVKIYHKFQDGTKKELKTLITDSSGRISGIIADPQIQSFNLLFEIAMETTLAKIINPNVSASEIVTYTSGPYNVAENSENFTKEITIPSNASNNENGAANILAEIYNMDKWLKYRINGYQSPIQITVNQINDTDQGTHDFLSRLITLGDPDMFTREQIYHEYGHHILESTVGYISMLNGFCKQGHDFATENCLRAAFTEGFSELTQSAVYSPNSSSNPNFLAYKWIEKFPEMEMNIETNLFWMGADGDGTNNSGERVEGAIVSVLWDIFDGGDAGAPDADGDGLNDGFEPIWLVLDVHKPKTFKEFWDGYMQNAQNHDRRQAFRKISEQNGIVYSRAKFDRLYQQEGFFQSILHFLSNPFPSPEDVAELVDNKVVLGNLEEVPKEDLHVAETEPLQNIPNSPSIVIKYRKRKPGEPVTGSPLNFNIPLWDAVSGNLSETEWHTATATVTPNTLFGIDLGNYGLEWDVSQDVSGPDGGDGFYDLLARVIDENGTYDTFYPRMDADTTKTVETMKWLRDLGTLTTVQIKPPHLRETNPLDGSVGVPVTQQTILASFHKPMDGSTFRVASAPSSFMFAMGDTQTLTDASVFLDNPSVIVREKCTGRRIRVLEAKYVEDKPTKKFELELKMHDDEAGPETGEKHLKDATLYEVTIISQEVKDVHGIHLDGNGDGVVQAQGEVYTQSQINITQAVRDGETRRESDTVAVYPQPPPEGR